MLAKNLTPMLGDAVMGERRLDQEQGEVAIS